MINNLPFFRFPFYPYFRSDLRKKYSTPHNGEMHHKTQNVSFQNQTETEKTGTNSYANQEHIEEKKSSKYSSIGPILINTNAFSNKEEPLLEFSGLKLYLDDIIILSLLFFLYKEDVKDDMLFILLILLLVS